MQYKHRPGSEDFDESEESLEEEWDTAETELRTAYAATGAGRAFDEVADEYRHGWHARKRRPASDWTAHEPEIRREWEENQAESGRSWEDARENIRRGWERAKTRHEPD